MDLKELISKLKNVHKQYPNSQVFIATATQVLAKEVHKMNAAYRIPVADNSRLGDQDGEVESLFIVTVETK